MAFAINLCLFCEFYSKGASLLKCFSYTSSFNVPGTCLFLYPSEEAFFPYCPTFKLDHYVSVKSSGVYSVNFVGRCGGF